MAGRMVARGLRGELATSGRVMMQDLTLGPWRSVLLGGLGLRRSGTVEDGADRFGSGRDVGPRPAAQAVWK